MGSRSWDIVVYGATGFTGKLVSRYLAEHAPAGVRFALAGRTEGKLLALRDSLAPRLASGTCSRKPDDVGIVIANALDDAAINDMVKSSRVVIAAAGPFAKCGVPLARAAARHGTHYADITGETHFVREVIDKCSADAAKSGAVIIPMAGFDSVPSDMGTLFTVEALRKRFGCATKEIRCLVRTKGGGVSGGTIASGLNMMADRAASASMADPLCLVPPSLGSAADSRVGGMEGGSKPGSAAVAMDRDRSWFSWVPETESYAAPWPMEAINTRCVRRSAALAAASGSPYCTGTFSYREWLSTRKLLNAAITSILGLVFRTLVCLPFFPSILALVVPKPGSGPSEEAMRTGSWELTFLATPEGSGSGASGTGSGASASVTTPPPRTVITHVRGSVDAYMATAVSVCEAAFALAEPDIASKAGGVYTPAAALGTHYIHRLEATGTFAFSLEGDTDRS